jgi:DNA-binding MarR family transcriptional regulator
MRLLLSRRAVSPLEAHLGYWLRFVSNHVSLAFSRKLEGQGATVAEWVVLRELYDRATMAPSELAGRLGMTRGAITKVVDRLEARALVSRTAGKDDRRTQALALTAKGRTLVPKLAALADDNDAQSFDALSAAERAVVEKLMRKIVARHALRHVPID